MDYNIVEILKYILVFALIATCIGMKMRCKKIEMLLNVTCKHLGIGIRAVYRIIPGDEKDSSDEISEELSQNKNKAKEKEKEKDRCM